MFYLNDGSEFDNKEYYNVYKVRKIFYLKLNDFFIMYIEGLILS